MACIKRIRKRYIVDFRIGRIRKRVPFRNLNEAKAFLREIKAKDLEKFVGKASLKKLTVGEAVNKYLESVTILKSPRTRDTDKVIMRSFLKIFRDEYINNITLQHLEFYQGHLREKKAAQTVNRHFHTICHFFNKCERWEYIDKNPCKWLSYLKNDKQKAIRIYTSEEVKLMIERAQPWVADVIFLVYRTGLRRKEVASLRWVSVDLEQGVFHIEAHDDFHPKGYKPRTIPMTQELYDFFYRKRKESMRLSLAHKNDYVFVNSNGDRLDPHRISKEVFRLGKRIGIEDLKLHNLRHTFCTNMVMAGENLEKIRLLAGHASLRTTEKYLHVKPENLTSSLERLAKFQDNVVEISRFARDDKRKTRSE